MMIQLFEHISDPRDFLRSVCQLLKEDGYLILDVPNINEALYRLYKIPKIVNSFFFKQQHPFTYSVTGLKALFQQFSLVPEKIELVQNYSLTNHINWLDTSKGDSTFASGMSRNSKRCMVRT